MSKRDRRVAARTKAATPPGKHDQPEAGDSPEPDQAADATGHVTGPAEQDTPLAKVIPPGIFDPFAEADKRW